jgi:hypothetical protein
LFRAYYIDASKSSGESVIRKGTFVIVLLWYFKVISGYTNIIQGNKGGLLAVSDLSVVETKTSANEHNVGVPTSDGGRNRSMKCSNLIVVPSIFHKSVKETN